MSHLFFLLIQILLYHQNNK